MHPMADIYELEPEVPTPDLPGTVVLRPSYSEAADALASDLYFHAANCVRSFGDFHIALPGGQSPVTLYNTLLIDPAYRDMPWKRTHIWLVSDTASSGAADLIRDLLVVHGDVPRDQFHPMDLSKSDADRAYAKELRDHLGWREKGHDRLDYVLLGLGADGSTAGYSSQNPVPDAEDHLTHLTNSAQERTLSLSMRLINASRLVTILATGADKQPGLEIAMKRDKSNPIGHIQPVGGVLRWYIDEPACSGIEATQ